MNPVVMNGAINSRLLSVLAWLTKELNFDIKDIQLTMLKSFTATVAGANSYKVPLCQKFNDLTTDKTQKQIGQSDAFAPVGAVMVARKVTTASGYGVAPTLTYPSKYVFDLTNENDQVAGLWRAGHVTLDVEKTAIINDIPGEMLLYAPDTLELAASSASSGSRNDFEMFTPLYKDVVLSGQTDASLLLNTSNYTSTAAIVGDTGETNNVGFWVVGFEIRGGAAEAVRQANDQQKCIVR